MTTEYNGWTNYETWNWKLWLDNDQGSYEYWLEVSADTLRDAEPEYDWQSKRDAAVSDLSGQLETDADERLAGMFGEQFIAGPFTDILNAGIGRINWHEIAESLISEAEETQAA
jgi:hypothetical protein